MNARIKTASSLSTPAAPGVCCGGGGATAFPACGVAISIGARGDGVSDKTAPATAAELRGLR